MKNVFVAAIVAVSVMSSVSFADEAKSKTTTETTTQQSAPAATTTTTTEHGKMDHKMSGKHTHKKHMKKTVEEKTTN